MENVNPLGCKGISDGLENQSKEARAPANDRMIANVSNEEVKQGGFLGPVIGDQSSNIEGEDLQNAVLGAVPEVDIPNRSIIPLTFHRGANRLTPNQVCQSKSQLFDHPLHEEQLGRERVYDNNHWVPEEKNSKQQRDQWNSGLSGLGLRNPSILCDEIGSSQSLKEGQVHLQPSEEEEPYALHRKRLFQLREIIEKLDKRSKVSDQFSVKRGGEMEDTMGYNCQETSHPKRSSIACELPSTVFQTCRESKIADQANVQFFGAHSGDAQQFCFAAPKVEMMEGDVPHAAAQSQSSEDVVRFGRQEETGATAIAGQVKEEIPSNTLTSVARSDLFGPEHRNWMSVEEKENICNELLEVENKAETKESNIVRLDINNCDLNLILDESGLLGEPLTEDGFAYMWAGVRGTYGVHTGKCGFEVKIMQHLPVPHMGASEFHLNVVRVGWSADGTDLALGEVNFSFGYGGTGKAATGKKFTPYGVPFGEGDVIGCLVDFDKRCISFTKNGVLLGNAPRLNPARKNGEFMRLFPHILSKNTRFMCNFGQKTTPWYPLPDGYRFINDYSVLGERLKSSFSYPKSKRDCQILMLIGLPCSGKTTWCQQFTAKHKSANFTVLGTDDIMDRMKVQGLTRVGNYRARWEQLNGMATKCLEALLGIAGQRSRNYILNQTNIDASSRAKALGHFKDFLKKAIVVVPDDVEFRRRCQQQFEKHRMVKTESILQMKANFELPNLIDNLFSEIKFVELRLPSAQVLVCEYNEEGRGFANLPNDFKQKFLRQDVVLKAEQQRLNYIRSVACSTGYPYQWNQTNVAQYQSNVWNSGQTNRIWYQFY